ncbi:L-rhamnonate dehydratase [Devosia sp.]|uniref:L-rhamnonate dehydratase n=1 Tax=Devosia sp. TaxID=1871048 RepID=UPI0035B0B0DA
MSASFRIKDVRVYTLAPASGAGTYFKPGDARHWLVDSLISNPMSGYPRYREKRSSWGIGVLGSLVVEIETEDGTTGVATGSGGPPAAWMIRHHFSRFLVGEDARNINRIWDELYRSSLPYGRKGLPIMAISAVDLALWDLVGKVRGEPVYNLIGGLSRDEITFYCTTPEALAIKQLGFWGAKVPLPHSPFDGEEGFEQNIAFLRRHREAVGPDYPLMVDCYMSLNVNYAIRLAEACRPLGIHWWEEVLSPDDDDGYREIKRAHPDLKWTTGEHEYTRYGMRQLIEERLVDILQPDVMWVGGLTETLRIAAHASAYDTPVVPHGSGPYSYHFIASQTGPAFCEYVAASADGRTIQPVFGHLFVGEDLPQNGRLKVSDRPGFGMELADRNMLVPVS